MIARVVLDTNVVVSGALKPRGLESKVLELVASRRIALFASSRSAGFLRNTRKSFCDPSWASNQAQSTSCSRKSGRPPTGCACRVRTL